MADVSEKGTRLIADIRKDAEAEAVRITTEADKAARDRVDQFERQMKDIMAEADKTAAEQEEAVQRTLQAAFTVEKRRIALASRDRILKRVLRRVEEKMAARVSDKNYRGLLMTLVVEAAIGLGESKVTVNASPAELALIDDKFLKEATAKVASLVMRPVTITKTREAPLLLQGIVLSAADGRTAFNNQIRTRLLRKQSEIRKRIYDRLHLQA